MSARKILQSAKLDPNSMLIPITQEEATEKLLEFVKEWKLAIKIENIDKKDYKTLIDTYGDAIITYHPENDHQEHAVFLRNRKMLKKYGLTAEDARRLDYC